MKLHKKTQFILFMGWLIPVVGCMATTPPEPASREAASEFDYVSRIEAPSAKALYFYSLAQLHMQEQQWQEAADALSKAQALDPQSAEVFVAQGEVLGRLGQDKAAISALKKALEIQPELTDAHVLLGQLLSRAGQPEAAIFHLKKAYEADPQSQKLAIQLAMVYANSGRLDDSSSVLQAYLDNNPDSLAVTYTLARVKRQQGQSVEAERLYRKSIKIHPQLQPAILELSQFLSEQKRDAEALVVLREAAEANPKETVYSHQIVQLLLRSNRIAEAQAELELILLRKPDDRQARSKLGIIYLDQKNWSQAEKLFTELVAEGSNPTHAYYLGIALENQDKTDEALQAYEKVPQESKVFPDAVAHRSYLLRRQGNVKEAVSVLNKALDAGVDRVEFYLYLASLLRQLKDTDAALQVLDRGATAFPSNTRFPYQKGIIQDESGRRDLAEQTMKKVLEMDPQHADALNYLAYLWAEQNRNLPQALEYIQRALERKRPGYMIDTLGWVYFKLGRLEEARVELEKAVSLLAEDMLVLEHLADVYAALGLNDNAIRAYETILKKNPEQPGVADKLKKLQGP